MKEAYPWVDIEEAITGVGITDSLEIEIRGRDSRLKEHAVVDSDEKRREIGEV